MPDDVCLHPAVIPYVDTMVGHRRHLHRYPELGFQEHRTAQYVLEQLRGLPLEIRSPVATTGIVATMRNGDGPCIGLRADMDALPIQETGDLPYRSVHPGVMHACGHDAHMAILLGTLHALHARRELWRGTISFIFQPAEEGLGGARVMVEEGALKHPDLSAMFGLHVWNYQPYGTVGVKSGPTLAASDRFTIAIKGVGGHGAAPQGTVDAICVAGHVITAIQTIVSRNLNPLDAGVISIGQIQGGDGFNIITDRVDMKGTVRAYDESVRALLRQRLFAVCEGIAAAYGAHIVIDYQDGYPPTINDAQMSDVVLLAARRVVGDKAGLPYLSMGGEDMAYFLREVPGCFFFVGSAKPGQHATQVPHHCSHFEIDERALAVGASVFVNIVQAMLPV